MKSFRILFQTIIFVILLSTISCQKDNILVEDQLSQQVTETKDLDESLQSLLKDVANYEYFDSVIVNLNKLRTLKNESGEIDPRDKEVNEIISVVDRFIHLTDNKFQISNLPNNEVKKLLEKTIEYDQITSPENYQINNPALRAPNVSNDAECIAGCLLVYIACEIINEEWYCNINLLICLELCN